MWGGKKWRGRGESQKKIEDPGLEGNLKEGEKRGDRRNNGERPAHGRKKKKEDWGVGSLDGGRDTTRLLHLLTRKNKGGAPRKKKRRSQEEARGRIKTSRKSNQTGTFEYPERRGGSKRGKRVKGGRGKA